MEPSLESKMFHIIGGYGPWQRNICIFLVYVASMNIIYSYSIFFMIQEVDFWCVDAHSELHDIPNSSVARNDSSGDKWRLTNGSQSHSKCWIATNLSGSDGEAAGPAPPIPCSKWEFASDYYSWNIVNEWDLVCERDWIRALLKSMFLFGYTACFISGAISDRIGRFPVAVGGAALASSASLLSAFSTSYAMFAVLRFLIGFGRLALTTSGYIILTEIVDLEHRSKLPLIYHAGFTIGFLLIPGIAWFVRRWSWLILVIEVMNIPIILMFWVLPESPRWLLAKRKKERFFKIVKNACNANGKTKSNLDVELSALLEGKTNPSKVNFLHLLKRPHEAKRFVILAFIWITISLLYYSVAYNVNSLAGNLYLNSLFIGIMEFCAKISLLCVAHRTGRKTLLRITMTASGALLASILVVPFYLSWLATALAMIVRYLSSMSITLVYLFTAELFATVVRNSALSSCSTASRVGTVIAPFTEELGKATHPAAPKAMTGALSILAGLIIILLPETKDTELADTIDEEKQEAVPLNGINEAEAEQFVENMKNETSKSLSE